MAGKAHVQAAPVYEEFEPLCKWQRNEDRDILEIHLQDFKKEQLRVQISNHGILKVSGERQLPDTQTRTKFHKEIPVPAKTYNTQLIHAKFVAGCLYITMPKLNPDPTIDPKPSPEPPRIDPSPPEPEPAKGRGSDGADGDAKGKRHSSGGNYAPAAEFELEGRKRPRLAKVAMSLAATAAAVAVLVAWVVYMYRSRVVEFDD